jgi:hypothetical protein
MGKRLKRKRGEEFITSVRIGDRLRAVLDRWASRHGLGRSDAMRIIVAQQLRDDGYMPPVNLA